MNHVKCIFNTSIPRRVSSNTGVTQCSNCKNEGTFKKRSAKLRSPTIDYSFVVAVKKAYPFLVQRNFNDTKLRDSGKAMLCGTQYSKSKSIAASLRRFLSERKLSLQSIDGVDKKQPVRFGSSSSLSYDRTITYDDDRDSRSYAQMITAYNETMMTVDNTSSVFHDRSNSKLNVQLSKTLFRTTSTLTSSAYNFENATIKENTEETSLTDLSYNINTIIDNNDDLYEDKTKNSDIYGSNVIPKTNVRSYANIIADYSASMDVDSIMKKYKNDFPKMSSVSFTSPKTTTLETSRVDRNVSEFASSPELNADSRRKMISKEELEWLRKVDKILNDLKTTTEKSRVKQKTSGLKEHDVTECIAKQAVWVDKSTIINKNKSKVETSSKAASTKNQTENTQKHEVRAEKSDKTAGIQAIHNSPTSSSVDSTSKKDWTQIPRNTETGIPSDPQVELRMVPSGNESIVAVNVEAIAKAMESRNPDSKELSVTVSSNNKESMKSHVSKENMKEGNPNFGSMRISISEESLPVKELELSINGKPISDVRSIKARSETLNVLTSMDKVEIRVPYSQNKPSKTNPSTKSLVKNVQSAESVLKLRIATAFDGTYPVLTTGVTKNVQPQSHIQPGSPKVRYAHTEGSNANTKMSEVPPSAKSQTIQEPTVKKIAKSDTTSSKKSFGYNMNQEKSEEPVSATIRSKNLGPFASTSLGSGDVKKLGRSGDIDLRLTKTFGRTTNTKETDKKVNPKATTEVKKDNPTEKKTGPGSKMAESSKKPEVKSASEKTGIKSLADIIAKHSGRPGDGNPSGVSGKSKFGSNQSREGSKTPGNKRDTKTTDETKNKSTLNNPSSKTDMFDQRISSKWSPWWSSSDTYVKLKKGEDYKKDYMAPTYVAEIHKLKEFDSTVKMPSKTAKESSRASEEEKTLSAKSQDPSKSKERKQETKESKSASSEVREAESTLKTPVKSENIRVTRYDSFRVNEKSKRHSFSSQAKIAEEKLNKRNEGPLKKEVRNASTSKEAESRGVDTKDDVKVPIKEMPKIDATLKSVDVKNQAQKNIIDAKPKDTLAKVEEKTTNEELIRQKTSAANEFPEKHLNMQQNVKKDSTSDVTKPTKSANDLSDEDTRLKNILNSMKPIEKKKDGTLIDYGVKVASRKKPEKLKGRSIPETTDVTKEKEPTDQRLDNQTDIKTGYSMQQVNANMQNPIKYSPKNVESKKEDVAKKESVSSKDEDIAEDENPINMSEKKESNSPLLNSVNVINKESLHVRISKVLEKARNHMSYQNVITESSNVKNVEEVEKSNEDVKDINSEAVKPEKFAISDKSVNEPTWKSSYKSKDPISYQNIDKESPKPSFKKEHPTNVKKAEHKSDEDVREPLEGTVVPKPSKSSNSIPSDTGTTEPFAGTIVRRSPKDPEKKKPRNVTYKHSPSAVKPPLKAIEKPNAPQSIDALETKTNKKNDDSSGSQNNSGTPSSPVNPSDSNPKMTKSNSHPPISLNLEKFNELDKLRCTEKVKQIDVKLADNPLKPKRPDKELVYSVWLQRSKEKTEDKKP